MNRAILILILAAGFAAPTVQALTWTRDGTPTSQAKALISAFQAASDKGLNPADYEGTRWNRRLAQLKPAGNPSQATLAEFDRAVTRCATRYVSDLHFGRENPGVFHHPTGRDGHLANLPAFVRQSLANATDVNAALSALEPPYPGYRRTEQALHRYLAMAREGSLPALPASRKTIEPGAPYAAAAKLAIILRRLGDLSDGTVTNSGTYDTPLVEAVKHFQARHGLEPDGRLGRATLMQLNTPLSRRIRQLQLAMERWHWVPPDFPRPPIAINIPEFRLRALDAACQTDLEMKVVVGNAYGGHQTPVFAADMKYVIFRPYWDVPASIVRKELIPRLEKTPGYFAKNRYEAVNEQGKVVSNGALDAATLAGIRAGSLRVRQIPGPDNALGLVKFVFPNEHDVYLHSTPATELFEKTRRDFSHGCIRVEEPEELADWVLHDKPGWTPERIHDAMNGDDTIRVTLDHPIPVLIFYTTAVVLADGEVRFFEDIYKQDVRLERLLRSGRRSRQQSDFR